MRKILNFNKMFLAGAVGLLFTLAFSAVPANSQTGGFKGQIKNESGKGIPSTTVSARQDGVTIKSVVSDNKGNFTLTGLKSGKYNLTFEADGYQLGGLFNVEVANDIRSLGNKLVLAIDPGTLVLIRGSIFSAAGFSIPGARIELLSVDSKGSTKRIASTYSNSSGEFAFRREPAGKITLKVKATYRGASVVKDLEVEHPAIYRTALTLDR